MKPDVPVVLARVSQALLAQIGPEIASGYAQSSALVARSGSSIPSSAGTRTRCPLEEMGRNSVSP